MSKRRVEITCKEDIDRELAICLENVGRFSPGQTLYAYAPHIACVNNLYDNDSALIVKRYAYAKEWNTTPYPGSFDDQPASWFDATAIISTEQQAIRAYEIQNASAK